MANARPDPLDRIIALSRPQQGAPPAQLTDPRNYLVFDRLSSAGALADAKSVFTTHRDGRVAVGDPGTVLGIVIGAVEPVTPSDIASTLADTRRDGAAYIPDWIAVSGMPTLAPIVEPPAWCAATARGSARSWLSPLTGGRRTTQTRTRTPWSGGFLSGMTLPLRTGTGGARPRCSAPVRS